MANKNYIIGAHRRIKSTQWAWGDRAHEGDLYEIYGRMYAISRASFRHFLEGDWEELRWEEEIESIAYAMKLNWNNCYNLWHKEPCNILAAGPDVMMVKPTKLFGEFDKFTMFNWTDPKSYTEPNPWNIQLPNYFNGDFKYYPSTMSEEVWALGKSMTTGWDDESNTPAAWNNEQLIENVMFWSQGQTFEEAHKPELFYQAFMINENPQSLAYANQWNNSDFNNAHVLHFAGTRGAAARLAWMEQIAESLGIPI